ncbi:MAG: DUF5914 domain-containing protein [Rhodococcus sp. (in: high G+C Gram-positive bacteria)]|uniref:DUF5914 domain-containing protein n=1 Tax=Rhodococcus sp. TaxID=1831 RepID=UPI003BB17579
MSILDPLYARWPHTWPLQPVTPTRWDGQQPTYRAADPRLIAAILDRTQRRPSGNWYVFGASSAVRTDRPFAATVAGVELVAWRDSHHVLHVGPGACPHLGAPLASAAVHCGARVCRWHGLRIDARGGPNWTPFPSHDDGVLVWVRLDRIGNEPPLTAPLVAARPPARSHLAAVATLTGICEPADIIANRLDPWHGAWFHPYSFTHLEVLDAPGRNVTDHDNDRFVVAVTFRLGGRLGVPVHAEFTSPDPRTVVMRIIDGEGAGSVVETHATPLGPGSDGRPRTAVIEAVIADSPRRGFVVARHASRAVAPLLRRAATRLWRDDLAYAERRYQQRTRKSA